MERKSVLKSRIVRARRNVRLFAQEYIRYQGAGTTRCVLKLAMGEKRNCLVSFKALDRTK